MKTMYNLLIGPLEARYIHYNGWTIVQTDFEKKIPNKSNANIFECYYNSCFY